MSIFRITLGSQFINLGTNINAAQRRYLNASIPATSGQKINSLSDDSTVIPKLFNLRDRIASTEQYERNVNESKARLEFVEGKLNQSLDVLNQIRGIALQANSPTVSASLASQMATQVTDLKTMLVGIANSQYNGEYIFAGTKITTLPFSGTPTAFNGNTGAINIQATENLTIQANLNGSKIFSGTSGGDDIFDIIDDMATAITTIDQTTIGTTLDRIDTGLAQILEGMATTGSRIQQAETILNQHSEYKVRYLQDLSDVKDADITSTLSNLVTQESALKIIFESSSRIMSTLTGMRLDF